MKCLRLVRVFSYVIAALVLMFSGITSAYAVTPQIDVGFAHSIAIKADGTLWAWGANNYGQLGDGTHGDINIPMQIGLDKNWEAISAGYDHTIALKTDGTLWAWGWNGYGQLGDGTAFGGNHNPTPMQVGVDKNWKAISAGNAHTVALKTDGTLWAWGLNDYGQLGDGTLVDKTTPAQIGVDTNWSAISAGFGHTIALKSDGTLWAWGWNDYGQLGSVAPPLNNSRNPIPTQIGMDTNWSAISAGGSHTMALKSDGTLWAWGSGYYGKLGDGTLVDKYTPTQIGVDTNWSAIGAGGHYSIALKTDGTLWAWGWNGYGEAGQFIFVSATYTPTQIGADTNWSAIAACATNTHIIALKTDGTMWAYGWNGHGQLGDGTIGNYTPPLTQVATFVLASYSVTTTAGTGGTISGAQIVNNGSTAVFTVMPDTGYHITSVTGCGGALSGNTYTTGVVTGPCTVSASFAIDTFTITASSGANGGITPAGAATINYGTSQTYTITPNTGYHIADVLVDGVSVGAVSTYTINNVTGSHTISASFADITPPSLTPVASQTMLWPPNNKMIPVTIQTNASDSSGKPVTLAVSITCNESEKGVAYWTNPVIDQNTGLITLSLMAGRFGTGTGRVYTVTVTATDASGNASTANVKITVPHSQAVK